MASIEEEWREMFHHREAENIALQIDRNRMAALKEINEAKFSRFHAKVCMVAGAGFFTDAYDVFAINIASVMLGYVYGKGQVLNSSQELGIKVAAPIGNFIGQLWFGWLADHFGRKRMYGVELMIIIVATFAQALSGELHAVTIIGVLVVWRFIMGIGIGGDYPLSAVITSEFASKHIRGRMLAVVFSAQGWGNFTACLVAFIVTVAYKDSILGNQDIANPVDHMWRILIGFGCVPGVFALYFRLTIPETPRFTMDIERNVFQATHDIKNVLRHGNSYVDPDTPIQYANMPKATLRGFLAYFRQWKNLKILLGTSWSWFALDIAFYGLNLNSAKVIQAIGFGKADSKGNQRVYDNLKNICIGNLILSVGGLLPGYYFTFLFIDSWGRKPIQLMGFILLTIIFMVMSFGYDKLVATESATKGFVVLYCIANFFQNFGPNATTFIIPGEVYPTRYRSTGYGIAAASGKLGVIIAQVGFAKLHKIGDVLKIFAFFMLSGIFSTLLLPETKNLTLEELSNECQEGFITGVTHAVQVQSGIITSSNTESNTVGRPLLSINTSEVRFH